MAINNIYIYPKELTPSMKKHKNRFYEKSDKKNNSIPLLEDEIDKYNIIEWDNGWAQFSLTENTLYIRTMFSEKDTDFKFEYLYELAKSLNKKEIVFETERNPEAWIRLLGSKNYKTKLKAYMLGVEI